MAEDSGSHPSAARAASDAVLEVRPPGWLAQVGIVFYKDLLIELKSGEVVTTSAFFAVLVSVVASFAFYGGPETRRLVASGVLWLTIAFSAVLSLGRSWQRERQENALDGLLAAPVQRSAIFVGKALGITLFLFAVQVVLVPVTALLLALDLAEVGPGLGLIALAATPGIAATGTLFGAMTVRTRTRDLLLAIVLFPLLSPTLLTAVAATRELLGGAAVSELGDYFKLIGVFDVVFVAGGLGLFGTLIER